MQVHTIRLAPSSDITYTSQRQPETAQARSNHHSKAEGAQKAGCGLSAASHGGTLTASAFTFPMA